MLTYMSCQLRPDEASPPRFIETLPNPVCIVDRENRVRFVNRGALRLLGDASNDDLLGHSLLEFLVPEDRKRAKKDLERCKDCIPGSAHEYHIVGTKGNRIPIIVTSAVLPCDGYKDCIICVGASVDVAKQTRQKRDLTDSKAMICLEILRNDVKNQLQIILSSIELLRENGSDKRRQSDLLRNVLQAVECCKKIIGYTEEMEHLMVEPLRLRRLDLAVRNTILQIYEERTDLNLRASFGVLEGLIMADSFLEKLIRGLIDDLCRCNPREDKWVSINIDETDREYIIEICDNGCGLCFGSEENPFNGKRQDSALRIHVYNTIAEKYGGSLIILNSLVNGPHEGIRVRLALPRY
jgi:PAS domain S-box-containing protein